MYRDRLPSGGREQTLSATEKQLKELERLSFLPVEKLRCTRQQASLWIDLLRKDNWESERALSEMMKHVEC